MFAVEGCGGRGRGGEKVEGDCAQMIQSPRRGRTQQRGKEGITSVERAKGEGRIRWCAFRLKP